MQTVCHPGEDSYQPCFSPSVIPKIRSGCRVLRAPEEKPSWQDWGPVGPRYAVWARACGRRHCWWEPSKSASDDCVGDGLPNESEQARGASRLKGRNTIRAASGGGRRGRSRLR